MRFGLLSLCGLMLLVRVSAALPRKTEAPPLVWSAGFSKRVRVTCPGLAVGELLEQLSAKAAVKLQADKTVSDSKVILFCPARPLKDTLNDLAELLHAEWHHALTADGEVRYTLLQTVQSTRYEQSLSSATYSHIISKLEDQVKALSETPNQMAKRPGSDPIRKSLADPENRIAIAVFAGLSPDQRTALFERRVLNFSAAEIGPQLAEPVSGLYKMCVKRAARFHREDTGQPAETEQDYARRGIQFALHNCGGKLTPAIYAYGKSSMIGFLFADVATAETWALGPHGSPYSPGPITNLAALPRVELTQKAQGEPGWIDQLQKLAELSGSVVLADFYRCGAVNFVPTEAAQPAPDPHERPEIAAVDRFCWKQGYLWWTRSNGALLFRKRDWFEQQRYEVPDSWLVETVSRMKAQKHVPRVADLLRAKDLTARQILGLNGINVPEGFSYSEFETVGVPELAGFLSKELARRSGDQGAPPVSERSLELGRSFEKAYFNQDISALASNAPFVAFLNAQAAPISVSDIRFFQVDICTEDRGSGPIEGWKDANIVVNWRLGPLLDKRMNVCMPFEVPNDRRAQVSIQVQ